MFTRCTRQVGVLLRQGWQGTHPLYALLFLLLLTTLVITNAKSGKAAANAVTWPTLHLQPVAEGFVLPVDVVSANDGTGRLFVVERGGTIRIIENGERLATPFLDIRDRVSGTASPCSECGLLGLAFPPDFATEGYFFVNYTSKEDLIEPDTGDPDSPDFGDTVVARFRVTSNPNVADADSEERILIVNQPKTNHNGGHILFGPDNYLYIGMGDGGDSGDTYENAQDPASLHGKLLRIDAGATATYTIPADNPFVGIAGYRDEIWMTGLRNPWRFSFDRVTGDLYIADVGQGAYEEINYIAADEIGNGGLNFGWPILEGNVCYPPSGSQDCDRTNLIEPVVTYDHSQNNCSVTGGHVYRSPNSSQPPIYLYADFCSGRLWGMQRDGDNWVTTELDDLPLQVTSFGEDSEGNIYLVSYSGTVYQVVEKVGGLRAVNDGPKAVGEPVNFTATITNGTGVTYTWNFGDGNTGSGASPTHAYAEAGIYTATVVARNNTSSMFATTTVYIGDAVVEVRNNEFIPAEVTVPVGGTVVWVLREGTHSVTADDGAFEQPLGANWLPFILTFNTAGEYSYYCSAHGAPGGVGMSGRVHVIEGNESTLHLPSLWGNEE